MGAFGGGWTKKKTALAVGGGVLGTVLVIVIAVAGAKAAQKSRGGALTGGDQNRVAPTEHKAMGFSDPESPELKSLASSGSLVEVTAGPKAVSSCGKSFLGMSFDLEDVPGLASPDYIALLKRLASFNTGPLALRIGGISADRLKTVWSDDILNALVKVNKATGAAFILGINLHSEDPDLAAAQIKRIQEALPPESILSFAVGNEPDMYALKPKPGVPGAVDPKPEDWMGTRWMAATKEVFKAASGGKPILAGPEWSTLGMKPDLLKWWLTQTAPFLNMVTIHHYAGDVFQNPSIEDLMANKNVEGHMSNLRNLLAVSKTFNLPLRITEAATLSYGGVQGVSDIAGAAIWVLDTAMEVCYNGAEGIIFHQNLEKAIARNANYNAIDWLPDNRVRVRMPYYGMLLVQQALAGGADMLDRNTAGECTAFVLKGRAASDLRVLVVNKAQKGDCAVDLKLTPEQAAKYADTASVDYLYAGGGLYEEWRLFLSGMSFNDWGPGTVQGSGSGLKVPKYKGKDGAAGFAVSMLQGNNAMLITIPMRTN